MGNNKDVHTEHCCVLHGCKYGDEDCPVATATKHQSYLCESCSYEYEWLDKEKQKDIVKKLDDDVDKRYVQLNRRKTIVTQTIFIEDWNEQTKTQFVSSLIAYDIKKRYSEANLTIPNEIALFVEKNDTGFFIEFILKLESQLHVLTNDELSFWESVKEMQIPQFTKQLEFEKEERRIEEIRFNAISSESGMDI